MQRVVAMLLLGAVVGCDNGATGVEACRRIEEHRCEAAKGCLPAIADDDDVAACQVFYRDQCLFGVADLVSPDTVAVDGCLAAIDAALQCQLAGKPVASCAQAPAAAEALPAEATGCDLILAPEKMVACAFIRPAAPGSGGAPGSGATAGSGGAGGGA